MIPIAPDHDVRRLRWLLALTCGGAATGIILSWHLWTGARAFPHFPVFNAIPPFPHPIDKIALGIFLALLATSACKPRRFYIIPAIALAALLALQDQMRWQPWAYQYMLMLFPFAFLHWDRKEERRSLLAIQQIIAISIYVWGGIHKCHAGFISVYENSLVAPILQAVENESLQTLVKASGYAIPPIETLIGIGLIFPKTRAYSIAAAIFTHILILILLGPVKGYISNSVVWPWNLAMAASTFCVFYKNDTLPWQAFQTKALKPPAYIIATLMLAAPILFYFGKWDRYLSFNLYSGRQKRLFLIMDDQSANALPEAWKPHILDTRTEDGYNAISLSRWSRSELNVPFVTEWRIIERLCKSICERDNDEGTFLFYIDYPHLPRKPKRYLRCSNLHELRAEK